MGLLHRSGRRGAALLIALGVLSGCVIDVEEAADGLGRVFGGRGDELQMTLVSNQENTQFLGRVAGGDPMAFVRPLHSVAAPLAEPGLVDLGKGKYVSIVLHKGGVYEIVARPPEHREREMTIAPPLSSRLSFTFEISDKTGAAPPAQYAADVTRPQVTILSPAGARVSGDSVTIVVTARTASGIREVKITLNGDAIKPSESLEKTRGLEFSTTEKLRLLPGQNLIHVAVRDRDDRVGYGVLQIERTGSDGTHHRGAVAPNPRDGKVYKPQYRRRVGAVIGINNYRYWPALEGATPDARRTAAQLRKLGFDEVIEIYDADATRQEILTLLGDRLPAALGEEDLAFIFFAGHGQTETLPNGEKRGYLIPVDGTVQGVFSTGISMETLRELSNRLPAKHVYYAMDSCYSGLGFTRGLSAIPRTQGYIDKVTSKPVVQMITAGMEGEQAIERGGRGLFTTYLLRALDGEADVDNDGYITAGEIGNFVRPGVTNASDLRQTPLYGTIDGSGEVVFAAP